MKYRFILTWCLPVLVAFTFSGGCIQGDFAKASSLNSAQNHPQAQQATPQYPNQNLVNELHKHIVIRFNDLTLSSFGLGRVPMTYLHVAEYETSTNQGLVMGNGKSKEENEVVKAIKDLGIDMKIYVVGQGAAKDNKAPWRVKGPIESNLLESYTAPKEKILELGKKSAQEKKPLFSYIDGMYFDARPIFGTQNDCFSCHTTKGHGDVLGVVVYVIK